MRFVRIVFLASAAVLLTQGAFAQKEPALTDRQIESFIASFPAVLEFGKRHHLDDVEMVGDSKGGIAAQYRERMQYLRDKGIYDEFGSIVRPHGFSSPEAWTAVAQRVLKAYVANSIGAQKVEMDAQMQAALRQLQSDPNIPAAQKEAILKQMQGSAAMMKELYATSPADKAAMLPHMTQLKELFEQQQ